MLFNSFIFIPFVLCVFVMALVAGQRARVLALIAFSYVFYSVPDPPWIVLLLLCTVGDFHLSRWIDRSQAPTSRRHAVVVSCALNLGLLAAYKYAAFLALSINDIAQALGGSAMLPVYQPDLPLGISFFVFESLSYTIDVYRRRLKPAESLADYALFICFFPHLIAGPIVRGRDFLPQIARHLPFQRANTIAGAELVAFGIFKKSVIADNLAPHVDLAFADPGSLSGIGAWIAVIFFAIQIYCDFSGYTDIARGLARILGFELGRNFNWPYLSQSISDFWRRWHLSLSTWLRDSLYIPLGGNRHGVPRMLWALLITWFLGGLWHGAAWHFALWGLYHGLIVGLGGLLYAQRPQALGPAGAGGTGRDHSSFWSSWAGVPVPRQLGSGSVDLLRPDVPAVECPLPAQDLGRSRGAARRHRGPGNGALFFLARLSRRRRRLDASRSALRRSRRDAGSRFVNRHPVCRKIADLHLLPVLG